MGKDQDEDGFIYLDLSAGIAEEERGKETEPAQETPNNENPPPPPPDSESQGNNDNNEPSPDFITLLVDPTTYLTYTMLGDEAYAVGQMNINWGLALLNGQAISRDDYLQNLLIRQDDRLYIISRGDLFNEYTTLINRDDAIHDYDLVNRDDLKANYRDSIQVFLNDLILPESVDLDLSISFTTYEEQNPKAMKASRRNNEDDANTTPDIGDYVDYGIAVSGLLRDGNINEEYDFYPAAQTDRNEYTVNFPLHIEHQGALIITMAVLALVKEDAPLPPELEGYRGKILFDAPFAFDCGGTYIPLVRLDSNYTEQVNTFSRDGSIYTNRQILSNLNRLNCREFSGIYDSNVNLVMDFLEGIEGFQEFKDALRNARK